MGVIYLRTCLANGKQYVGQANDFNSRQNAWNNIKWRYANQALTDDRAKYGLENWSVEILYENTDKNILDAYEQYYIKLYNTVQPNGYNLTTGGKSGFSHSAETIKKMSELKKGEKNPMYGATPWNKGVKNCFSEETIKKMSESRTGEKNPFYGKTFKIPPMLGKHLSDEAKQKISNANKNGKTAIPIIQIKDNGEIIEWPGQREASRNGYDCGSISRAARGIYKKCGHHYKDSFWYYKDDYYKTIKDDGELID